MNPAPSTPSFGLMRVWWTLLTVSSLMLGCALRSTPRHPPVRDVPQWHERWYADGPLTEVGAQAVMVDLTTRRGLRQLHQLLEDDGPVPAMASTITLAVDHWALQRPRVLEAIRATAARTRVWIEATRLSSAREPLTDDDLRRLAEIDGLDGFLLTHRGEVTERGVLALLERQPSLRAVHLYGPIATDRVARQLGQLSNLRRLSLAGAAISDAGVSKLGSLSRLESLDISGTDVTDVGVAALADVESLRTLKLGATDERHAVSIAGYGIEALGRLPRLSELSLAGRRGLDRTSLAELPHLRVLDLSGAGGWSSTEPLGALVELQELDLSDSDVTKLDGLEHLTRLRTLDLSQTRVDATELIHLRGLPHLDVVYVGARISCSREGSIPIACEAWEVRTW